MFPTHLLLGITAFVFFHRFFPGNLLFVFFLVLLGSILPDLDAEKSKINRWSGFIGIIVAKITTHRGIFHSVFVHLLLALALGYWTQASYGAALFLGYCTHIVGDGISRQGLRIFTPFSKFRIRGPVLVGGFVEQCILVLLFVTIVYQLL